MSYTLYYSPGAASMAVHWMLIEIGVPFEAVLVDIRAGAQRTGGYLRLNPAGRVPTLVIDGVPYTESAALLMLLSERHPEAALAPSVDAPERPRWLEQMIYLANTLLPAMRDWFYADTDGDPSGAEAVRALARRRIEAAAWDLLNTRLADGRSYLVGQRLSTVDLLTVMLMRWSRNMPRRATSWPDLADYIGRLRTLPSFIELNRREGLPDWPNGTAHCAPVRKPPKHADPQAGCYSGGYPPWPAGARRRAVVGVASVASPGAQTLLCGPGMHAASHPR